jgi:putative membrane protein
VSSALAPFRLAFLELKRFRTPLRVAGLVFLALIPLLYGAIYLWSNWNPYGQLASVPVAVVDEDQAVTVGGQQIAAGAQVVASLKKEQLLGWRFVSAADAASGLREGRYYAVITVPADFSAKLASGAGGAPQRASMSIRLDDANNYLVGIMAQTVQSELERQIAVEADTTYFQTVIDKLGSLRQGLGSATSGANALSAGLGTAGKGSGKLLAGMRQLDSGAGQLAPGAAAVAAGVHQVTTLEAPIASQLASALPGLASRSAAATSAAAALSGSVTQVTHTAANMADSLLSWLSGLPDIDRNLRSTPAYLSYVQQVHTAAATGSGSGLASGLARLVAKRPDLATLPGYRGAVVAAHLADGSFSWLLSQLAARDDGLADDPVYSALLRLTQQFDARTRAVDQLAQRVNGAVISVNAAVRTASANVPAVQSQLRSAASQLYQLDSGAAKVASGLRTVHASTSSAVHGVKELDAGNAKLRTGATQLAGGLSSASGQLPTMSETAARVLAAPVSVTTSNAHPAGVYGRGLAPFFFAIALWVFGIVAFLLLRPVSGRLLASSARTGLVTAAAWLPVLAVGVTGALVLFAVVDLALGLNPVNALGTIGLMVLGVAAFSAIVHVLRLAFGAAGDALALVLLMIQLVSCGGLYPVETLPLPFRVLHRLVPMTYLVRSLRVTISGGNPTILWHCVAILAAFLVAALALLALTVHRQRTWTMARLKPELELLSGEEGPDHGGRRRGRTGSLRETVPAAVVDGEREPGAVRAVRPGGLVQDAADLRGRLRRAPVGSLQPGDLDRGRR